LIKPKTKLKVAISTQLKLQLN